MIVLFLITLVSFPLDRDVEFAAGTFGNAEPFVISSSYIRSATIGLIILFLVAFAGLIFLSLKQDLVVKISNETFGRISAASGQAQSNIPRLRGPNSFF